MFRWRLASALVGAPLILLAIWLGTIPLGIMAAVLTFIALIEFYLPWPNKNIFPTTGLGVVFGMSFPILAAFGLRDKWWIPALLVTFACVGIWQMFSARKTRLGVDTGITMLGVIYAGMLPSYIVLIRELANGRELLFAVVLGVWACDSAAYIIGSTFGKHPLAPSSSPKKTIEGAIGGCLAGAAVPVVFALLGLITPLQAVIIAVAAGVLSQVGDLFASMIKREVGIKDFGATIPGHGGVLDRFDGLFFIAPLVFYLLSLV